MSNSMRAGILSCVVMGAMQCASTAANRESDRPPVPTPAPSMIQLMGYDESVRMGAAYASAHGYEEAKLQEVTQANVNVWRIRFGLDKGESKRFLNLEIDRSARKIIKAEENDGVSAKILETP